MKKTIIAITLAAFTLVHYGCNTKQGGLVKPDFKEPAQKYSYMIGTDIGSSLKGLDTEIDTNALIWGILDILNSRPQLLTQAELDTVKQEFSMKMQQEQMTKRMEAGTKNLQEGEAFLEENKKKPGVITTESGLQYIVIKEGSGPKPTINDKVKVNYKGTLVDGKEFDNSYKRGQPAEFQVSAVIPGWTEGLQLMNPGSHYQLFIPSKLAYADRGAGPDIGPNAVIIFDVELISIEK